MAICSGTICFLWLFFIKKHTYDIRKLVLKNTQNLINTKPNKAFGDFLLSRHTDKNSVILENKNRRKPAFFIFEHLLFYKEVGFHRKILMNTTALKGLSMKYKHFREIEPSNKTDFIMLYFAASRSLRELQAAIRQTNGGKLTCRQAWLLRRIQRKLMQMVALWKKNKF